MKTNKTMAEIKPKLAEHLKIMAAAASVMLNRRVTLTEIVNSLCATGSKFSQVQYSQNAQSQAVMNMYEALNKSRKRPVYKKITEGNESLQKIIRT
jgi:type II secretory pathway predicted ATPase ExeA